MIEGQNAFAQTLGFAQVVKMRVKKCLLKLHKIPRPLRSLPCRRACSKASSPLNSLETEEPAEKISRARKIATWEKRREVGTYCSSPLNLSNMKKHFFLSDQQTFK